MAKTYRIGIDCQALLNSASFATPTWGEIADVQDVTVEIDHAAAELKSRDLSYALNILGLKMATVQLTLLFQSGDADFESLRDAFTGKTIVDIWFADGAAATSGTQGLRAEFFVKKMSNPQPMEEGLVVTFDLVVADNGNTPEWRETA